MAFVLNYDICQAISNLHCAALFLCILAIVHEMALVAIVALVALVAIVALVALVAIVHEMIESHSRMRRKTRMAK